MRTFDFIMTLIGFFVTMWTVINLLEFAYKYYQVKRNSNISRL